jgi:hypothetical protein
MTAVKDTNYTLLYHQMEMTLHSHLVLQQSKAHPQQNTLLWEQVAEAAHKKVAEAAQVP